MSEDMKQKAAEAEALAKMITELPDELKPLVLGFVSGAEAVVAAKKSA